jgi:lycopene cyclase domain-containing protein
MSYTQFLIVFVCVPLAGLAFLLRRRIRRVHLAALLGLAVVAVVYTTPWDNYLVATGVWYYDPRLVLNFIIGHVPIEEYAFFVAQTFLTGLFGLWLWGRLYRPGHRQAGR